MSKFIEVFWRDPSEKDFELSKHIVPKFYQSLSNKYSNVLKKKMFKKLWTARPYSIHESFLCNVCKIVYITQ